MEFYPTFNFRNRFKSDVVNWHRHFNFGFDLIRCLEPKSVVELGVHKGDSYFCFCESIKQLSLDSKCYGIDTWKGDQHSGNYEEEVYQEVERFNKNFMQIFLILSGIVSSPLLTSLVPNRLICFTSTVVIPMKQCQMTSILGSKK